MIAAARSVWVWLIIIAFMLELVIGMFFSIYVLWDARRDHKAVRRLAEPSPDALVITAMFVRTETTRLVKMSSFLLIILLSLTQPVPDQIQDGWYIVVTRVGFLVIGAGLALNSIFEYRTRRLLNVLKERG